MEKDKNEIYKEMRINFCKKFKEECVPILQEFKKERVEIKKNISKDMLRMILLSIPIGILVTAKEILKNGNFGDMNSVLPKIITNTIGASLFLCISTLLYASKPIERKIKRKIMPILCNCFDDLKWIQHPKIDYELYKNSGLFTKNYDMAIKDDIFRGSFQNVPFSIEEIRYIVQERKATLKSRYKKYKKIFISLQMNKNFNSHTLICSNTLFKQPNALNLRHTTLEDIIFEKEYDVYTNDEIEARYLLTTAFMERFVNIKQAFNSSEISCAFYQNKFIISLDTQRDFFNLNPSLKKLDDPEQFMQMYEEIESIIKLIDYFKLYQKTKL